MRTRAGVRAPVPAMRSERPNQGRPRSEASGQAIAGQHDARHGARRGDPAQEDGRGGHHPEHLDPPGVEEGHGQDEQERQRAAQQGPRLTAVARGQQRGCTAGDEDERPGDPDGSERQGRSGEHSRRGGGHDRAQPGAQPRLRPEPAEERVHAGLLASWLTATAGDGTAGVVGVGVIVTSCVLDGTWTRLGSAAEPVVRRDAAARRCHREGRRTGGFLRAAAPPTGRRRGPGRCRRPRRCRTVRRPARGRPASPRGRRPTTSSHQPVVARAGRDPDGQVGRTVPAGVVQGVDEQLTQPRGIGAHGEIGRDVDVVGSSASGGPHLRHAVVDEGAQARPAAARARPRPPRAARAGAGRRPGRRAAAPARAPRPGGRHRPARRRRRGSPGARSSR